MKETRSVIAIVIALLVLILVAAPLTFYLINRPRIPTVVLPVPNAYDTLIRASKATSNVPIDYAETTDVAKLSAYVAANRAAVDLADQAILQDCVVPINYRDTEQLYIDAAMNRPFSRLLIAKARSAALQEDYAAAADDYAKVVVLNSKLTNGGLLIHLGGAFACERQGLEGLLSVIPKLSMEERQPIQDWMTKAKREPIDFDALVEREIVFNKIQNGVLHGTAIASQINTASPFVVQSQTADQRVLSLYDEVQAAIETKP